MNTSNQYSAFYAWIKELHNAFIPFLEKPMLLPHLEDFLASFIVLLLAYTAFSLVGFGSALIAGAPLAHYLPVSRVIPLLALLDFIGASRRAWQSRQLIDPPSLRKLLPGMLIGQMIGVYGLIHLPLAWTAILLGGFISVLGLRGLIHAPTRRTKLQPAFPQSLLGGVLGGLFGSGGFMYARYLEQTLENRETFRATQAILIAFSTAWRLLLCLLGGTLDLPLLLTALILLPAVWIGQTLGQRLDDSLNRTQLTRILNTLLLVAGMHLMSRYWGS